MKQEKYEIKPGVMAFCSLAELHILLEILTEE